ncbi:VOC family protein [Alicyclobacillus fodiniaquatilis]|uniref:VOC family protein n=1 Tax=Alicyclobacillus fodiniaquatilis TaxID=1661150 RepID=A0ABW4JP14_9BACL
MELKSAYLGIPVSDLQAAAEWYGKHFGFKVVTEDPIFLELITKSGVRICLTQHEPKVNSHINLPSGPFPVQGFIVSDAELVYQGLKNNGVQVGEFFDYQGKSFSFYDLDGNFIEVWSLPDGNK